MKLRLLPRIGISILGGLGLGLFGQAIVDSQRPTTEIRGIATIEDSYFARTGKYLQVLPDSRLPHYESGNVADKLGRELPANSIVDVYEAPEGPGYQVRYTDSENEYSVGYGPEAKERTWIQPLPPPPVATSTDEKTI